MELVYQGRYFDGRSSKPYTVNVSWLPNGLLIRYTNDKGEHVELAWDRAYIHQTQLSRGIVTLRYGDIFPYQQLEVTDPDFISQYRREYRSSIFGPINLSGVPLLLVLVGGVGVSIWLAYLFLLPVMADYAARVFPKEYEIELGDQLYESILAQEQIDTAKTRTINLFFNQLEVKSEYPVRITVVKNDVVNAFALPGGGIVVYDAILKDMKSADQLAALLSHEYSHVQLKHATRNVFRSFAGYIFISVLFSDVSGIAAVLIENAHQLRNLSYSRELETEADNNGLLILKKNQISAAGMKALFEQLKKENPVQMNELISTHPDLDNRIRNVQQFMKKNTYPFQPNDSLLYYFDALNN